VVGGVGRDASKTERSRGWRRDVPVWGEEVDIFFVCHFVDLKSTDWT